MIAEQHQGAQQNITELCRSVMSPPWGVTERAEAQTIVARPSPVVTENYMNPGCFTLAATDLKA